MCACATTPASSHACSSSRLPQRACTSEHARDRRSWHVRLGPRPPSGGAVHGCRNGGAGTLSARGAGDRVWGWHPRSSEEPGSTLTAAGASPRMCHERGGVQIHIANARSRRQSNEPRGRKAALGDAPDGSTRRVHLGDRDRGLPVRQRYPDTQLAALLVNAKIRGKRTSGNEGLSQARPRWNALYTAQIPVQHPVVDSLTTAGGRPTKRLSARRPLV